MAVYNSYFPTSKPAQIPWLANWIIKFPTHGPVLGYTAPEIAAIVADATWALYCIERLDPAAKAYAQSMTAAIKLNLFSEPIVGSPQPLPGFALPTPVPTQVMPGALTRTFKTIRNLKTRAAYTLVMGEDLNIIGEDTPDNPDAIPRLGKIVVRGGEVIIPFVKDGHLGVAIECSIDGGPWEFITIDTSSPYNDARPLAPGKLAEKRRYRLCFWDGAPTNVWVTTEEIAYGGQ